jgi:hypothetical protein
MAIPPMPAGMPSPEEKQARNAAAVQRYGANPPTMGARSAPPGAKPMMSPNPAMSRPLSSMGAKPPPPPGMGRPMGPMGAMGAKPPAPMGGAFGMRPPSGAPGPFGAMTKAPMQTGQASPFAGRAAARSRFGGNFGGAR